MQILLTGADGLLGSNLVRELKKRKHSVKAFLLPGVEPSSFNGVDIKISYGNILNKKDIAKAIKGCDAVIHAAADTSVWPSRSEIVKKINIDGTRNILELAKANNIKRFIHIGSASSFGYGTKESPGLESTPFIGDQFGLDYIDSKLVGQKMVIKAAKEEGFPALVVAPTFMFGPYDSKPGSGRVILAVYNRKLKVFASGGRNFVHVKDVAIAIANSISMGKIGESYIAGHQNLNYKEIFSLIADTLRVPVPNFQAPNILIKSFGCLNSTVSKILNSEPIISYPMAKIACNGQYYSSNKAVNELKMPQTDIKVAVKESFEWFKKSGYC